MAVYEIESPNGDKALVECRTKNAAINHVASKGFKATVLNTKELVKRVHAGATIETLVEAAAPKEPLPAPILDKIAEEEEEKALLAAEDTEVKRGFSGRFQKKSA